jgi:hypothetical protein
MVAGRVLLLAAVFLLMGEHCVFGVLAPSGGEGDFLLEWEIFTAKNGGNLRGLHPMMLGDGFGEFSKEPLLLDACDDRKRARH